MVLLGGLEIVAAGYLIHKHQQNKKDKQRLEEEAAALEESQYRIFPSDQNRPASSQHRRRRSHSRESSGRHSHERRERRDRHDRPHSADAKYRRDSRDRRDSGRPPKMQMNAPFPQQAPVPAYNVQVPVPIVTHSAPPPVQQQSMRPPPPPSYNATTAPTGDMKYGWTDETPAPPPQAQDPNDPPTGWPAHWAQSQTPPTQSQPQRRGREGGESSSRGRHERRSRTPAPVAEANTSRVRFAGPPSVRSLSRSPPPSYRV